MTAGNWTPTFINGTTVPSSLGSTQSSSTLLSGKAGVMSSNTVILSQWDDPATIIISFLAALGIVIALVFAVFVAVYRDHPVIKRSSPLFCSLMVLHIHIPYNKMFVVEWHHNHLFRSVLVGRCAESSTLYIENMGSYYWIRVLDGSNAGKNVYVTKIIRRTN